MEFLMTWGWAILAVLIVLGVLAYFKVLSPGDIVANQCRLAQGLYCKSYKANESGVTLLVFNALGRDIVVTGVVLPDSNCSVSSLGITLLHENAAEIFIPCNLSGKRKLSSMLKIVYDESDGLPGMSNNGKIIIPVSPV